MDVNDRLFAPPAPDAAKVDARLIKLPSRLQKLFQRASDALARNDTRAAQATLTEALTLAPHQPDVLRLYGLLLAQLGNFTAATANFEAALHALPDDAVTFAQYARLCEDAGKVDAALQLRRRAVEALPESPLAWADLGEHLSRHQDNEAALAALATATRLAADYAPAFLKYGGALVSCGRAEEGAAAIRRALAIEPAFGAAWLSLSDIKTVPITADEAGQMRALLRGHELEESEKTAVEFALGRACEEAGAYREAYDLLVDANARRRKELRPWLFEPFHAQQVRAEQIFSGTHATAEDPEFGREVIFIAGMPRSGTTLVEQILASHHKVHGAGELGEFAQVLTEESTRLQCRYPEWVPRATPGDWRRLGQRYLELSARFRKDHPISTDKMPNNWQALGAMRAMLPGAYIVICRRDPVENCWSCFKQFFPSGWEFTYDLDQLAAFWKVFDRTASHWARRDPAAVREQGYEALTEHPDQEIRALLDFCGLPFDPACLAFHQTRRSVHTLSAGQVRQPMRPHTGIAAAYGNLLDPLRRALDITPGPILRTPDRMNTEA